MGTILSERRNETDRRLASLKQHLGEAEVLCGAKACVYATGSFARGEAHATSDLDLFIVGQGTHERRDLSHLDEIRLMADLIEATRQEGVPDFSGDGKYLEHYLAYDLKTSLGKPEDDSSNTFTARLLLLLESRPLLAGSVYTSITESVVASYWRDYPKHKQDFIPAFLTNDILRLWRTFCVNYEARTRTEPEEERARRKLKNYKLKFSRLLTCYSAIVYLLSIHSVAGTVGPQDAAQMIRLTPTMRLEWVKSENALANAHGGVDALLNRYETFLENSSMGEDALLQRFLSSPSSKEYFNEAAEFGNEIASLLQQIGRNGRFHRLLLV